MTRGMAATARGPVTGAATVVVSVAMMSPGYRVITADAITLEEWKSEDKLSRLAERYPYRYQRGALGIAHAIGLARDFIGDDPFCVVLGDNIIEGNSITKASAGADGTGSWSNGCPFAHHGFPFISSSIE